MKNPASLILRLAFAAALAAVSVHSANAAANTWDGDTNGNWDVLTNWVTQTTIPGAGELATFNNNVNTTISLNGADRSAGSFTFNGSASTGNFTFNASGSEKFLLSSGGVILISNGNSTGSVITYNVPISLGGNYTLNNANNQAVGSPTALIFNGNITNTANSTLTLGGPGSGANKINGIISDGGGVQSILASPQGTIGSYELSGNNTFTGTVTKDNTGLFILSGSNAYLGQTTVSAGILNIRNSNALGDTVAGTSVSGTARLELQGGITVGAEALTLTPSAVGTVGSLRSISGDNTYGGLITLGAAARINSDSGNLTISNTGTITGATFGLTVGGAGNTTIASIIGTTTGGLTKDGAGTLTLSGLNTYTGATSIAASGGTLSVNTLTNTTFANALGQSSNAAANLLLGTGSTLRYTGAATNTDRLFTLNGTSNSQVFTLDASGGGAINFTNTGALAYGTTGQSRTLILTGTNTADNSLAATIGQNGAGIVTLTKNGTGTWVLSNGNNSYTGITTINGGILSASVLANGASNSNIGASSNSAVNLVINGGTLQYTGGTVAIDRRFTAGINGATIDASGTGALTLSGTLTTLSGTDTARTITLTGTNTADNTYAAALANNGTGATTLAKTGTGKWVITGATAYTGATNVNAGTLLIGVGGSLTATSGIIVATGATLSNSSTASINRVLSLAEGSILAASGAGSGFAPTAMMITGDLTGSAFTSITAGTSILTKAGNLSLTLSGVTAGTYNLLSGSVLGSFSTVEVNSFGLSTFDSGLTFTGSTGGYDFTYTNASNVLAVSAIPEPSTWILLAFSLTTMMVLRRRRAA